jgi:four helix bundle protein
VNGPPSKTVDKPGRHDQGKTFDLEERTAKFAEAIIGFCNQIPRSPILDPLVHQMARSGTSVGANYAEANNASSRNDFAYKIGLCRKEASETMYWLRLMGQAHQPALSSARELWCEAKELNLIFSAIFRKSSSAKKGLANGPDE